MNKIEKVNPLVRWWVTPELPVHDIFGIPLLINKSKFTKYKFIFSQWTINPIKRRLARWYLKFLQKTSDIKVIGITGSAGKTTTKEILYAILNKKAKTICTRTFIDPVFNIPNTILATPIETKYLILEMGVEYPGEMDFYLWLAKPDVGIITNIFPTHLEFMQSIEGVFDEKKKLVYGLPVQGTAILNGDDEYLKGLNKNLKCNIEWFNSEPDPIKQNENAARTAAKVLGLTDEEIVSGVSSYKLPAHRFNKIELKNGALILDDTYNSNPAAAIATIKYFESLSSGKVKIAVMGEMRELGTYETEAHKEVGKLLAKLNYDYVIGVGDAAGILTDEIRKNSKKCKTYVVGSALDAVPILEPLLVKNSATIIKGSRSLELDKIINKLS